VVVELMESLKEVLEGDCNVHRSVTVVKKPAATIPRSGHFFCIKTANILKMVKNHGKITFLATHSRRGAGKSMQSIILESSDDQCTRNGRRRISTAFGLTIQTKNLGKWHVCIHLLQQADMNCRKLTEGCDPDLQVKCQHDAAIFTRKVNNKKTVTQ